METRMTIRNIQKLKVTGQMVEEADPNIEGETIRKNMTTVSFQFEGLPGMLDSAIVALTAEIPVDVIIGSSQANLGAEFMSLKNKA